MKKITCLLMLFICLFACASGAMEGKINQTLENMTFAERAAMINGAVDKTAARPIQARRQGLQTGIARAVGLTMKSNRGSTSGFK